MQGPICIAIHVNSWTIKRHFVHAIWISSQASHFPGWLFLILLLFFSYVDEILSYHLFSPMSLLIRLEKVVFTSVALSWLYLQGVPPTGHLQGGHCNDINCHYGAARSYDPACLRLSFLGLNILIQYLFIIFKTIFICQFFCATYFLNLYNEIAISTIYVKKLKYFVS